MKTNPIGMAGKTTLCVATVLAMTAPARAVTSQGSAELSNISFTFSDPANHLENYYTSLGGATNTLLPPEYYSGVPNTLFAEQFHGMQTTSHSGQDGLAALSASTSASNASVALGSFSAGAAPGYVSAYSEILTVGRVYLAPSSSMTFSADYALSASAADGTPYLGIESIVAFYEQGRNSSGPGPQQIFDATSGQSFQQAGKMSWTISNDTAVARTQDFGIHVLSSANTSLVRAVPEPNTWALSILGLGFTGLGWWRQRRRTGSTASLSTV